MKKVCILTATRAEYGLLRNVMYKFLEDKRIILKIIVTGMHLCREFGETYREIEKDGFTIDERIPILLNSEGAESISSSMGIATMEFGHYFAKENPDLLIVLGDRYETLAVSTAAMIHRIPIAHIHGGEISEGALDDVIRHSITKMSYLHFTSTERYRQRVIQLGESPERVYYVGALGVENVLHLNLLSKNTLEKELGLLLDSPYFVATYHPETLDGVEAVEEQIGQLLCVAEHHPEYQWIFTKANADEGGKIINACLENSQKNHSHIHVYASLGLVRYLSALKYSDAVVGNSSSGILEAPSFNIPTINIGNRQRGRIQSRSVINCESDRKQIENAIIKIYEPEFREQIKNSKNPYEKENTSESIYKIIKGYLENEAVCLAKTFYDLN